MPDRIVYEDSEASQKLYDEATIVPGGITDRLPSEAISVSSLLAEDLPPRLNPSVTSLRPAEQCITEAKPEWTAEALLQSPMPPSTWVGDMDLALKQRLRSNNPNPPPLSLQHPTISNLRPPLWAIKVWYLYADAIEQRNQWREAFKWLTEVAGTGVDVDGAKAVMGRLEWGMLLWPLGGGDDRSHLGVLSELLSTRWLRERHLDLFASYLMSLQEGSDWWIGGIYFAQLVRSLPIRPWQGKRPLPESLVHLGDTFTKGRYKYLIFPALVNNNHWIVLKVDIGKREITYGASHS